MGRTGEAQEEIRRRSGGEKTGMKGSQMLMRQRLIARRERRLAEAQ